MMIKRSISSFIFLATIFLTLTSYSLGVFTDYPKVCPNGNLTVLSGVKTLVTPATCYPVPFVNRTSLQQKPQLKITTEHPALRHAYTILMLEADKALTKYDVHWMETNYTLTNDYTLMLNHSIPRDVRKIREYLPPKMSKHNMTYLILIYRQYPHRQVYLPVLPFSLARWVTNSSLKLVGGAEFIVTSNGTSGRTSHSGLPFVPVPIPLPGAPLSPSNTAYGTYNNHTNHSIPSHHGPPPYNPHPQPPPPHYAPPSSPYNPNPHSPPYNPNPHPPPYNPYPQPPSYNPNYHGPPQHRPNQFHPPISTGKYKKKSAANGIQSTFYLIPLAAVVAFLFHY